MRRFLIVLAVLTMLTGNGWAQTPEKTPAVPEPSLVSFSAGALLLQKPKEYNNAWSAFWLLDENPKTGWATPKGVVSDQVIVIALPEQTLLKTVIFDTANIEKDGQGARDVVVEMSDQSANGGFEPIAAVTLEDRADNQSFPVSAEVPGRWVRLTVKNNHGAADYLELFDFRATGKTLTRTPFPEISGTYKTDYNDFHILQEGTSLSGCYEYKEGLLNGGIEGRVMKLVWREGESKGPAIMVFSPDGKKFFGLWWHEGGTGSTGNVWNGTKKSAAVGGCPHWSGGAKAQIQQDLEKFGRALVYGINFDVDSDRIRDESKPTLDKIVAVLKAKPEWQVTIEGHTDSTGGEAHNRELSNRRADSVKAYLAAAGIDAARLTPAGFGASRPVASNDTELGRAQNRRVELVKK